MDIGMTKIVYNVGRSWVSDKKTFIVGAEVGWPMET